MSGSHSQLSNPSDNCHASALTADKLFDQFDECLAETPHDIAEVSTLILESVSSGILLIDAVKRTIVYANDAAASLINAPKSHIVGHICHKFVCPASRQSCPMLDCGEKVDQSEKVLLTADGKTVPIIKTVIPIEWHQNKFLVESFTDISSLKKAQSHQDELMQKLEQMNLELTDFAYIVSHDLKAPLRGIKSLADWIVSDHSDTLNEEGKKQLILLQKRVDKMQNLIDGILEYSRLGQVSENIIDVDLNQLLPDIIDTLAIPSRFTVEIQESLPILRCEKTRITQIFQNLLSNAVKYIDKSEGHINISCTSKDNFWCFSVEDNGPGIDRQFLDKIFQLFQTLQTKDQTDSTGIGLSVVKKSVTMYGGTIWVESTLGKGSTFYFTFPQTVTCI